MSRADSMPGSSSEEELQRFGYRQEFRRDFKRFTSFAIVFSFISVTTGIFATYGSVLNWGGPLGIWTWPISVLGQGLVALVFAALAARIPLAGYSYQWASRLATPMIGWFLGWVSFTQLMVALVSVDYSIAQTVLPSLLHYSETPGNAWLITTGVIMVQMVLILFSTFWTTRINNIAVGTEVIGLVGLTVLLVCVGALRGILHPDHLFSMGAIPASGYFSLGTFTSVGPFVRSFLLGAYAIVGFEAAANMSEETENEKRVVPFNTWSSVLLVGIVGMAFLMALNLASGDVQALTGSATPIADIVTQTLHPVVGSFFLVVVAFSMFACGLIIFVATTRLVWAMSRDRRFPGYQLFRRVNERTNTPLGATVLCGIVLVVILAGFANQTTALQNLFSTAAILAVLIYLATVILYACTRHKFPRREHGFHLGPFEWPVVVLALVWLVFELSIFRDATFTTPWLYILLMFGIGLLYFLFMFVTRRDVLKSLPLEIEREGEVSATQPDGQSNRRT
jgi:amino acid transporter